MPSTNIFSTRLRLFEDDDRRKTQQQQQQTNAEAAAATPAATTPATQDAKKVAAAHATGQNRGQTSEVLADGAIVYKDRNGIELERHYVDKNGDVERVVYRDGTEWKRGQDDGENGVVWDTGDDYSDMTENKGTAVRPAVAVKQNMKTQAANATANGFGAGTTGEKQPDGSIVYRDNATGEIVETDWEDENGNVIRAVFPDGREWTPVEDEFDVNDEGDKESKEKAKRNHFVPDNTPTAEDVNMRNTDLVEMPQGSKKGVPTQPGKFEGVVEPDEDKWDRMMREEKEKYEAGKARLMELLRETESEEDKKKRERRERAGRIASGIGDMTSALANLVFTAKGGPNAYTGKDTLSEASRERYERLKKEREADEAYNAKVRTALENWEKDYRALLQKMEAAKDTRDAKSADLAEKKRHNTKMEEEAANRNRITEEENKRKAQAQANKPVKQRTNTSSSQSGGKKKKSGRKPEGWRTSK